VLLVIDRFAPPPKRVRRHDLPLPVAFLGIGLFQCLAWFPGFRARARPSSARCCWASRSGRRPSSRFFLAIPTMAGAFASTLVKSRDQTPAKCLDHRASASSCRFLVGRSG
jgi:undecaprenyl pyrophosphate phosphatase UppP